MISNKVMVSFVFDDNRDTHYDTAYPLFQAQGEVACFAVISNNVGITTITWDKIIEMEAAGWEILSHSHTHIQLANESEEVVRYELETSKRVIESHGLICNNFAWPYSSVNTAAKKYMGEYYRSARSGTGNGLNGDIDLFELNSMTMDEHTNTETYKSRVDDAESTNKWLIFLLHSIDSDDETNINEVIDYIQSKNIPIVTINQGLDLLGLPKGVSMQETGTSKTRAIATRYPVTDGLTAGTTTQEGHKETLEAEEKSLIKSRELVGL